MYYFLSNKMMKEETFPYTQVLALKTTALIDLRMYKLETVDPSNMNVDVKNI